MPNASTICCGRDCSALPTRGGSAHRAEHRGRVKARLVHHLRRDDAEPAHDLDADRDALERGLAVQPVPLAGRQHRRDDHRAGMHRAALEGVVEILAVRRGAVDEGRARARSARAYGRSRCRARPRPSRRARPDVVLVARGEAEADHVDQQSPRICPAPPPAACRRRPRRCARRGVRRRRCREVCVHVHQQFLSTMHTAPVIREITGSHNITGHEPAQLSRSRTLPPPMPQPVGQRDDRRR